MANFPYPQNFRSLGHPHGLQKLVDENENENEKNRQLLYLRNSFAAAGKNVEEMFRERRLSHHIADGGTEGVEAEGTAGAGLPRRGSYTGKDTF